MLIIYDNSRLLGNGRGMLYCMAMDCLKVDKWPKNLFGELCVNKLSLLFSNNFFFIAQLEKASMYCMGE